MSTSPELTALVREIAKDLALETAGTWVLNGNDASDDRVVLKNRDGLMIHFGLDWHSDKKPFNERRLKVQTWKWPTWVDWKNDEPSTQQTSPGNLYNPNDTSPDITVAISRGSAAIAREIKRRFLPEYQRIWTRLVDKARENQKYAEAARDNWRDVCKLLTDLGKPNSPRHNHASVTIGGRYLNIENRGHVVHITADLTVEQFTDMIKALLPKENQ